VSHDSRVTALADEILHIEDGSLLNARSQESEVRSQERGNRTQRVVGWWCV